MSSRKTYGLVGINNAILYFTTGRVSFKVEFKGGSSFGQDRPATFTTADAVVQAAIENDSRFINGPVKLMAVYKIAEPAPVVQPAVPTPPSKPVKEEPRKSPPKKEEPKVESAPREQSGVTVIEDVTDINGIRDYLKTVLGVKHQALNSVTSIKRKIAENNLSFPNAVFE